MLFTTDEEFTQYLVDRDFTIIHAEFLEDKGKYENAARLYLQEGDIKRAIGTLCKASNRQTTVVAWTLDALWNILSFAVQREDLATTQLDDVQYFFEVLAKVDTEAFSMDADQEVRDLCYHTVTHVLYLFALCSSQFSRLYSRQT